MSSKTHHEISHLCAQTACMLLSSGAESALIVSLATRLGIALGASEVECTLTTNSIVYCATIDHEHVTRAVRVREHGVNMTTVAVIQRMVLAAEEGRIHIAQTKRILQRLPYSGYSRHAVATMVALSCACFAWLAGADLPACAITFIASLVGMWVRQLLSRHHFNVLVVFSMTAFVATLIGGSAISLGWGERYAHQLMASSILMLVPGFPLINSVSDGLKGYMNMGVGRWMLATVLTLSASLGVVLALKLLGYGGESI